MSYFNNQKAIDDKINELKKKSPLTYLQELDVVNDEIEKNRKFQRECHSDFCYWGYSESIDTLLEVKKYLESQIVLFLKERDSNYVKTHEEMENKLNAITEEYKQTVHDLSVYKPSNYKNKIELLNKVFTAGDK